jgi:hypothetical protein
MMRRFYFVLLLFVIAAPAFAQGDALNLPAALYVLTNDGVIQRYGQGAEGIETVSPADQFILDFGISSDDEWIAYRTEDVLTIVNRTSGEEKSLEGGGAADIPPVRGLGDTIAWSPASDALVVTRSSGARVYFSTDAGVLTAAATTTSVDLAEGTFLQFIWSPDGRYLAGEAEDNIWWIYRHDGQNIQLTSAIPSATDIAWVNNSELVFTPVDGGLILMNLDKANAQTVLLADTSTYSLPYLLPDGVLIFYGREKDNAEIEPGSGLLLGLKAGSTTFETYGNSPVNLADLRWAPGGGFLVAFQDGSFLVVDPVTGQSFPLPVSAVVAYSWGPLLI